jgi:hypothetical protein
MPLPNWSDVLQRFIPSRQLLPGSWANAITDALTSIADVTASTTQTQAGGTRITAAVNAVTTANANDAVTLPKGKAGMEIVLNNLSANALGVFPAVGDIIFPSAADAVLAQTASRNAIYRVGKVSSAGVATWYRNLSA